MRKAILAGGSGLVGRELSHLLTSAGWDVVILSRKAKEGTPRSVVWDGETLGPWVSELEAADALINLAGHPVSVPWTEENKRLIVSSRVNTTTLLGEACTRCKTPPKRWVQASAVGIYPDLGDTVVTEDSPPGPADSFLVKTCLQWEAAARGNCPEATSLGFVRIGIVLSDNGGMLEPLIKLTKAFLGGHTGTGRQYVPWIHELDLARLFQWMIDQAEVSLVNGSSPEPATMAHFMEELRKAVGRPWSPPVPTPMLKLASALRLAPDASLALSGVRAIPEKALASGFTFTFPDLTPTLKDLLVKKS
jgi:uncharacterized protein (TIGR01777 family)